MKIHDNYFDTKLVPDYCSKSFLNEVYNCYLHNLKESPYKMQWVTLDRIEKRDPLGWQCIGDKYLEDSCKDKMKLAIDIYENGTYFPVFTLVGDDGKMIIRDGIHRIYAMRELINLGYWENDRKILVATDKLNEDYMEGDELTFYIPMMVIDDFIENYPVVYDELFSQKNILYTDSRKYFAVLKTTRKGYLASSSISLLLRNAFFEYKEKFGETFKPSEVINDYEVWKEWRGY